MSNYAFEFFQKNMQTTFDFATAPLKPIGMLFEEPKGGFIDIQTLFQGLVTLALPTLFCLTVVTVALGLIAAALQAVFLPLHFLFEEAKECFEPSCAM